MDNNKTRFSSAIGRIILALFLGVLVLALSSSAAIALSGRFPGPVQSLPMGSGFVVQAFFLVLSTALIFILSRGAVSNYGFSAAVNIRFSEIVVLGLITGILSAVAGTLVPGEIAVEPADASLTDIIIGVWVLASIAEEVLTRGLIQGFLRPLTGFGFSLCGIRISIPVLISTLFFGLMHLGMLSAGADFPPVAVIVVFAFILGLIAGYHREKSGSLIPAITVHICANIGAYLTELVIGL
jgi:membrane protease YdiL (CAAX protease family)